MSKISKKSLQNPYTHKGDHHKYLYRIKKTLYYSKFPKTDRLSLPVTELAAEIFSETHRGKTLQRLHYNDAAIISHNACISPCSLVLAVLYLERLKTCNPGYLEKTAPSDLFLVSLMVSSKFLFDDGAGDEVYMDEWAASGDHTLKEMVQLEKEFLDAIDWKIYVSELAFWEKLLDIEITLAGRESKNRGFLTYTEIELLSRSLETQELMKAVAVLIASLATTYVFGVMVIIGSVYLASQIPGTSLSYASLKHIQHPEIIPVSETMIKAATCENNSVVELEPNQLEHDIATENENCTNRLYNCSPLKVDAVNVLKTSILLASIKPSNNTDSMNQDFCKEADTQYVSWDWWTVPVMNWLYNISKTVTTLSSLPSFTRWNYLEVSACNMKTFQLEDQIHKATKIRIQDQIEGSWHKEWTESILFSLFYNQYVASVVEHLNQ